MINESGRCVQKMWWTDQTLTNLLSNIGNSLSDGEIVIYGCKYENMDGKYFKKKYLKE